MQTNRRLEIVILAIIAGMFAASAILWSHVPDRMPVHWNLRGQVDRYGGKLEGLLLLPTVTLGLHLLFLALPWIDPRRANYQHFARAYKWIQIAFVVLMTLLHALVLGVALGYSVDVGLVVPLAVGVLFCLIGNFMGKFRPNWFVGVRTPWTLSSDLSWNKTNRLGGRMFIVTGIALLMFAFVQNGWMLAIVVALIAAMVTWLPIYSYLVWRRDGARTLGKQS
ncbi:MAG: SdpI family protein [Pirellulales bacterium]